MHVHGGTSGGGDVALHPRRGQVLLRGRLRGAELELGAVTVDRGCGVDGLTGGPGGFLRGGVGALAVADLCAAVDDETDDDEQREGNHDEEQRHRAAFPVATVWAGPGHQLRVGSVLSPLLVVWTLKSHSCW